jgi:hypothetical protein
MPPMVWGCRNGRHWHPLLEGEGWGEVLRVENNSVYTKQYPKHPLPTSLTETVHLVVILLQVFAK